MLQTNMENWRNEKQKEWKKEGSKEGKAETLLQLLHLRFSTLPDWVDKKVLDADLDTLTQWINKILSAQSPQDIFGEEIQVIH